uniref:hypothetical protein n=1 Tax=Lentilactobacillus hilgardii TaxID=1588 RepID=UPI00403F370B
MIATPFPTTASAALRTPTLKYLSLGNWDLSVVVGKTDQFPADRVDPSFMDVRFVSFGQPIDFFAAHDA